MESSRLDRITALAVPVGAARRAMPIAAGLQALVLVLVTANLGRIPLVSTGQSDAPLLVNDLAVATMVALGATVGTIAHSFRIDRVAIAGLLFAVIGGASALVNARTYGLSAFDLAISLAYLARWLMYFGVYLVVINVVRKRDALSIWRAVEAALLVIAAFGIFQSAFLPRFAQIVYPDSRPYLDWDIQGYRLVSTVLEPNVVAAMLLVGLLVQLAQLSVGAPVRRWKPVVLFAAMVLTLSRSGALGLIAGVSVILLVRGLSKRLLRLVAAIVALIVAFLPKLIAFAIAYGKFSLDGSAAARLVNWAHAWQLFREHPWFGVGFNTFGFVEERYGFERFGTAAYSADGGLLFVAVLTGVVGLAVYTWMLSDIGLRCRRVWRDQRIPAEHRGLAIGAAAVIVALCVDSVFVNTLLATFVMELMWIVAGLAMVVGAPDRSRRQVAPATLTVDSD